MFPSDFCLSGVHSFFGVMWNLSRKHLCIPKDMKHLKMKVVEANVWYGIESAKCEVDQNSSFNHRKASFLLIFCRCVCPVGAILQLPLS